MASPSFDSSQKRARSIKPIRYLAFLLCCVLGPQVLALGYLVQGQGLAGSIKGTVTATTGDAAARPELLPGASVTLVNRDLSTATLEIVTDETGNFAFRELAAGTYTLTAEANGLPRVTKEIHLTTGSSLVVEIVLTATLSESVTIRDAEGLLSTGESTTSNTIRAEKLEQLLVANFDSTASRGFSGPGSGPAGGGLLHHPNGTRKIRDAHADAKASAL